MHFANLLFLCKLNAIKCSAKRNTTNSIALSLNSFLQWDFYYDEEVSKVMGQSVPLCWPESKGPPVLLRKSTAARQQCPPSHFADI